MKEEYEVIYQRGYEVREGKWLNAGLLYSNKRVFKTLDEAIACKNKVIESHNKNHNSTYSVNGIGITMEWDENDTSLKNDLKLVNIKIRKRQVSKWEEV